LAITLVELDLLCSITSYEGMEIYIHAGGLSHAPSHLSRCSLHVPASKATIVPQQSWKQVARKSQPIEHEQSISANDK
jgi:hypothetical protein